MEIVDTSHDAARPRGFPSERGFCMGSGGCWRISGSRNPGDGLMQHRRVLLALHSHRTTVIWSP